MKKARVFLMFFVVSMFFVSGCGQKQEKDMNSLELIKKRGKIIVGTEAVVPPYEFVENGKIVGYNADILAVIVKNLGVELEHHDVEWSGILTGLTSKKFDLLATSIAVNPERKEKYGLTTPIGEFIYVFTKNASNTELINKEQLGGKKIGCTIGGITEKHLAEYNKQLENAGKPTFEIVHFKGIPDAFLDLDTGRIDAVLCSETTAKGIMKKKLGAYEIFDNYKPKERDFLSWAVRKEDKELLEFINSEILKMKKSGKLAELQQKWFGYTIDLPDKI